MSLNLKRRSAKMRRTPVLSPDSEADHNFYGLPFLSMVVCSKPGKAFMTVGFTINIALYQSDL